MTEYSGRPGTCRSKLAWEAIVEPWMSRSSGAFGSPKLASRDGRYFSNRNRRTSPLVVQCSTPRTASCAVPGTGGALMAVPPRRASDRSLGGRGLVQKAALAQPVREAVVGDVLGARRARRRQLLGVEDRLHSGRIGVGIAQVDRLIVVHGLAEERLVVGLAVLADHLHGERLVGRQAADAEDQGAQVALRDIRVLVYVAAACADSRVEPGDAQVGAVEQLAVAALAGLEHDRDVQRGAVGGARVEGGQRLGEPAGAAGEHVRVRDEPQALEAETRRH